MAKTQIIKLKGKANWAKVFEDNRDMKGFEGAYEECEGAYTIDVLLDKENYDVLRKSGSMKKGSITEEGIRVKFVRKHKGPFPEVSGPPVVLKKDGTKWDYENDGAIGNDSDVELTLSVYQTSRSRIVGTRLDKIVVTNAVEFDDTKRKVPASSFDDDEVPF